jgi:predicted nucleotidyltransferase
VDVFDGDVEVYIFGLVVEDRLTVDSDIDVAVVVREVPRKGIERARLIDSLWKHMEFKRCHGGISLKYTC